MLILVRISAQLTILGAIILTILDSPTGAIILRNYYYV